MFLYRGVLDLELGHLNAVRSRRLKRLPTVLAREELAQVLALEGAARTFVLMPRQLYGCGLRLIECCDHAGWRKMAGEGKRFVSGRHGV